MTRSEDTDPLALGWEWSTEEIKRFGYQVVDLIADHLTQLPERPVWQPYPAEQADALLRTPAPREGQQAEALLEEFASQVAPYPFGNGHPRFYAWVNSPPTVVGIFAEALAAAMNPSCAGGNHAAVYLEREVLEWFKQMVGFPAEAMGLLVSGGSMATLTALAVARHTRGDGMRAGGLQQGGPRLVVYRSEQGHSCVQKAVELLGLGSANLRTIPVDAQYRMQVVALEAAIEADLAAGLRPMAVVSSAGTTNTGAIDPLAEIAAICRRHGLWLHVDGAYGAAALLTDEYKASLGALALADSLALDPHKWLSIPYEAGLVLVRDAQAMRDTFSLVPEYLRLDGDARGVQGPPWFSEYGFMQTRGFLALKVWMSLKYYGLDGYTRAIEHDLHLARHLASRVEASAALELAAPPSLSVVCFRYTPAALRGDNERLNALNKRVLERVQLGGKAFLAGTTLGERFVLRACILNHRSTRADIDQLVAAVLEAGEAVQDAE
ncbi:MAG TPA: aminotransferase class V-fold PLP-dependent enzyme [Ktedonobacterales bacterium]|nr:aminotransferase class V-fold PLP-dependent enzyme [Ktedonobacterales bacterium]